MNKSLSNKTILEKKDYIKNYYKFLTNALDRIGDGSFGVCVICDDLIPEERMMEVPNANKCVGCKEKEKLGLA